MAESYQPFYSASHALLIGINSYTDPRLAPLGRAEDDAQAMAALLSAAPYHFSVKLLLGQQATKRAILEALYGLRNTGPDDRLLIYFAGHGYTLSDRLGSETGFLAAADTVPEQDFTALEMENVISLRRHAEAKHIAFVFDACFSGQALGLTRTASVAADKLLQRRAYQVISAGAGDQTVADFFSMTGLLIDALREEPVVGPISLNTVGLYVQQRMAANSRQLQIPQFGHLSGSQGGDLVFREASPQSILPADLVSALRADSDYVRWGAVVELVKYARGEDEEQAAAAHQWLQRMADEDPYARVREAALAFFAEEEAHARAQAAWNIRMTDRSLKAADVDAARQQVVQDAAVSSEPGIEEPLAQMADAPPHRRGWLRGRWTIAGLVALAALVAGGVYAGLTLTRSHPGGRVQVINDSGQILCSVYASTNGQQWTEDLLLGNDFQSAGVRRGFTLPTGTRWITAYPCVRHSPDPPKVRRLIVPSDGSISWVAFDDSDF